MHLNKYVIDKLMKEQEGRFDQKTCLCPGKFEPSVKIHTSAYFVCLVRDTAAMV